MAPLANDFYKLGRGKALAVSAEQKRGRDLLLRVILDNLPPAEEAERPQDVSLKLAIVGRRNVGKSTFINSLIKSERMIVSEVAGTTRDSVDVRFERDGLSVHRDRHGRRPQEEERQLEPRILFAGPGRAVDPPGRRGPHVPRPARAHFPGRQETDRVHPRPAHAGDFRRQQVGPDEGEHADGEIRHLLAARLPDARLRADRVHHGQERQERLQACSTSPNTSTSRPAPGSGPGELNKVVREALDAQPPPMRQNRRPKVYYATQVAANPPTIVLFTNGPQLFDNTYERYLHQAPARPAAVRGSADQVVPPGQEAGRTAAGRRHGAGNADARAGKRPSRRNRARPTCPSCASRAKSATRKWNARPSRAAESELWRDL